MTKLYDIQEIVAKQVFETLEGVLLCGGTALARCYLQHRVSYDLDFFMNSRFDPQVLLKQLNEDAGIQVEDVVIDHRDGIAVQIHGMTRVNDFPLKISFIEDVYDGMFPTVWKDMGSISVCTDDLDGLMHRKLRTISGVGLSVTGHPEGGRQAARDLFDIYVLSTSYKPVPQFIEEINKHGANFPAESYEVGVKSLDWFTLLDDFDEMETIAPFAVDVKAIRKELERL